MGPRSLLVSVLMAVAVPILGSCGGDGPDTTGPRVVAIAINEGNQTLVPGGSTQLTVTVKVQGGAVDSVLWTSSNEAVATVSESGVVAAMSAGTVTITATSTMDPGKSASVAVSVSGNAVVVGPAGGIVSLPNGARLVIPHHAVIGQDRTVALGLTTIDEASYGLQGIVIVGDAVAVRADESFGGGERMTLHVPFRVSEMPYGYQPGVLVFLPPRSVFPPGEGLWHFTAGVVDLTAAEVGVTLFGLPDEVVIFVPVALDGRQVLEDQARAVAPSSGDWASVYVVLHAPSAFGSADEQRRVRATVGHWANTAVLDFAAQGFEAPVWEKDLSGAFKLNVYHVSHAKCDIRGRYAAPIGAIYVCFDNDNERATVPIIYHEVFHAVQQRHAAMWRFDGSGWLRESTATLAERSVPAREVRRSPDRVPDWGAGTELEYLMQDLWAFMLRSQRLPFRHITVLFDGSLRLTPHAIDEKLRSGAVRGFVSLEQLHWEYVKNQVWTHVQSLGDANEPWFWPPVMPDDEPFLHRFDALPACSDLMIENPDWLPVPVKHVWDAASGRIAFEGSGWTDVASYPMPWTQMKPLSFQALVLDAQALTGDRYEIELSLRSDAGPVESLAGFNYAFFVPAEDCRQPRFENAPLALGGNVLAETSVVLVMANSHPTNTYSISLATERRTIELALGTHFWNVKPEEVSYSWYMGATTLGTDTETIDLRLTAPSGRVVVDTTLRGTFTGAASYADGPVQSGWHEMRATFEDGTVLRRRLWLDAASRFFVDGFGASASSADQRVAVSYRLRESDLTGAYYVRVREFTDGGQGREIASFSWMDGGDMFAGSQGIVFTDLQHEIVSGSRLQVDARFIDMVCGGEPCLDAAYQQDSALYSVVIKVDGTYAGRLYNSNDGNCSISGEALDFFVDGTFVARVVAGDSVGIGLSGGVHSIRVQLSRTGEVRQPGYEISIDHDGWWYRYGCNDGSYPGTRSDSEPSRFQAASALEPMKPLDAGTQGSLLLEEGMRFQLGLDD